MKPLEISEFAQREVIDAAARYAGERRGLAVRFLAAVSEAYDRIERHPKLFSHFRTTMYRKCFVKRFPYKVYFLERDDTIWIAAVAHQKRREGYWLARESDDK